MKAIIEEGILPLYKDKLEASVLFEQWNVTFDYNTLSLQEYIDQAKKVQELCKKAWLGENTIDMVEQRIEEFQNAIFSRKVA